MPDYVEDIDLGLSEKQNYTPYIIGGIILVIIILIVIILLIQRKKNKKHSENKDTHNNTPHINHEEKKETNLDDKIKFDILHILKLNQGAMTQKNLRKHFDYSEAKISLMIKALEQEGKIEKEKHGTINFIKIK